MEHWDDIRFFLAVARHGSVCAASSALNVNHSTVLRRMAQLEGHLGVSLFNKLPSGYELTEAGDEILQLSERMEETASVLQTRVFARDQRLVGKLRIAVPPTFATDLLMSDLAEFSKLHPEIELQIVSSYDLVNLTMRQADLAIRLVYDQQTLPQHLFATKLHPVYRGVYIHRQLGKDYHSDNEASYKWILKEEDGAAPEWATRNIKMDETICWVSDLATQLSAVRAQMGVTILPCFLVTKIPI